MPDEYDEYLEWDMAEMARCLIKGISRDDLLYLYDSLSFEEDVVIFINKLRRAIEGKLKLK